jgi:hypothetical protein
VVHKYFDTDREAKANFVKWYISCGAWWRNRSRTISVYRRMGEGTAVTLKNIPYWYANVHYLTWRLVCGVLWVRVGFLGILISWGHKFTPAYYASCCFHHLIKYECSYGVIFPGETVQQLKPLTI